MRIWTVGHGTRSTPELIALLREAGVASVADVRIYPGSHRHPHFGQAPFRDALAVAGIGYEHLRGLGGRRDPRPDSPHTALKVSAFRGYADHMASEEFARDLERLERIAHSKPTAYLCAETLWADCHRRMLSDLLTVRGWEVVHLLASGKSEPHRLWNVARVIDGRLLYDGGRLPLPTE